MNLLNMFLNPKSKYFIQRVIALQKNPSIKKEKTKPKQDN